MGCDPCNALPDTGPAGPRGARGITGGTGGAGADGVSAFTTTTASFVMPAVNATVVAEFTNASWVPVGIILFIDTAGYMQVTEVDDLDVTLINLGYAGNASPAAVIASGVTVSPAAPIGASPDGSIIGTIIIQQQVVQGTGGGVFTSGAWRARILNTTVEDTDENVLALNVSTGVFQLRAGKYYFAAFAPAFRTDRHKARLRNITTGGEIYGTSEFSGAADNTQTVSEVRGILDLAVDTELILEHQAQTTSNNTAQGMGVYSNFGTEIYAQFTAQLIE